MPKNNDFVYEQIKEFERPLPFFEVSCNEHYGQCAEDLIVLSLVKAFATRLGRAPATLKYLEIGAHHPIATSAA